MRCLCAGTQSALGFYLVWGELDIYIASNQPFQMRNRGLGTHLNQLAGQRGTAGCRTTRAVPRAYSRPTLPSCRSNRLHSPRGGSSAFGQNDCVKVRGICRVRSHCGLAYASLCGRVNMQ